MTSKKFIEEMFDKGILVSKEMLEKGINPEVLEKITSEADLLVINSDYADIIKQPSNIVDWSEIDRHRVNLEKERDDELYQTQLQQFKTATLGSSHTEAQEQEISSLETELNEEGANFSVEVEIKPEITNLLDELVPTINDVVTVVVSYVNVPHKYTISDFANFFVSRYKFLEKILRNRRELQNATTISRALGKNERESVGVIGVVEQIGETRNGNLMITLEDLTGKIKVLISKNKNELYKEAKDLVVDEVIGVAGVSGDKIIFAENVLWPDIPANNEIKKGPEEEYVIFLSDIHVGHKLFLEKEFEKFLDWINGKVGNDVQKSMAAKVKYIFIAGDLVDGIGIYPGQDEELTIPNIADQYKEFTRLIAKIPQDKQIIICPGNHDMVHLAEPQPVFYQEFSPDLFNLPNVTLVTNPAVVNIGKKTDFSGFDVLMYHGYSFDYYVANVESIRMNGGYHRADLIMKFLLKRRHLAPSFKSTPYYPSHKEDPLLIKTIPDFLITGHIHYSSVANYKGVTMISGSCWQATTAFQEKLGHSPEPGRIPVVNLKTREVKVLRFV